MRIFRTIIESVTDGIIRTFTGSGEAGGTIQGEIIQQVLIKSHPFPGDSGLVIQDGNRHYLIASDNDIGPGLGEGEFVLSFDADNYIKSVVSAGVLDRFEVKTDQKVVIEAAGEVSITGSKVISQAITELAEGLGTLRALVNELFLNLVYNLHNHAESGGGTTGVPNQQAVSAIHATQFTKAS